MKQQATDNGHNLLSITSHTRLVFVHTKDETNSPTCVLDVRHPGTSSELIAFKIKTSNRRRYLVQPSKGLLHPGQSKTIIIRLHEDERRSEKELNKPNDKFLVQSCEVPDDVVAKSVFGGHSEESIDVLDQTWKNVTQNDRTIFQRRMRVHHEFIDEYPQAYYSKLTPIEEMSPNQIIKELRKLRVKYSELLVISKRYEKLSSMSTNSEQGLKWDILEKDQKTEGTSRETSLNGGDISTITIGKRTKVGCLQRVKKTALRLFVGSKGCHQS